MLSVHDISTHARSQVSLASLLAMGTDPCAVNPSGREPWLASLEAVTGGKQRRSYGFTAISGQ
jgi:hypothetical protein